MKNKNGLTEFSESEYKEFFSWLLNKEEINLQKEADVSKVLEYEEPYIYYTPEIKDFFETTPMKRLGKIGQLVNVSLENPNASHTRLSHCKGAYQKMLEFYMRQFQKKDWIEKNSLESDKLKILADIMDMASHDIGHNVCSHALEKLIASYKGAHEILGKRILQENSEIREAFCKIHPKLLENIDLVKQENYKLHNLKEGNIDFDRADFLIRDSIYLNLENGFEDEHGKSQTITEIVDKIMDNCEIYTINRNGKNIEVPVFSYEVFPEIEEFLKRRVENYENIYTSKENKPVDLFLQNFCKALMENDDTNSELTSFLNHITKNNVEDIDLDEFIKWNDIRFYNALFDIIDNTKNEKLKNLARNCLPRKQALIQVVYERLFPNITPKIDENGNEIDIQNEFGDEEDRKFYLKMKQIVESREVCKKYLREESFESMNRNLSFDTEEERNKFYKSLSSGFKISETETLSLLNTTIEALDIWNGKIKVYNKNEPIFILGKDKKIYTFEDYPERKLELSNIEYYGIVAMEEKLSLEGVENQEIKKCISIFDVAKRKLKKSKLISQSTRYSSELKDIAYKKLEESERTA